MRYMWVGVLLTFSFLGSVGTAAATGTVSVQKTDGSVKVYTNAFISIQNQSMSITSSDGAGTIVLGRAACTAIGALLKCLPYAATLYQDDKETQIPLETGTVWFNPTQSKQQLSHSSASLGPRGVLVLLHIKNGAYVSLSGTVDEVRK
jgi:hypothetical protein